MHDTEPGEDDGLPTWQVPEGRALLDGQLAMTRLAVGLRCETWLVWSVQLWCPAIVKLARPLQVEHPRARAALGREVDALAGLAHPGLPRLLTDGRDAAIPHLMFEYLDGPELAEELDDGPLNSSEGAQLATQLLSALALVHERGIAHVDVKPENVLVCNGRAVLLDFGSARPIGAEQPSRRPIGTAGYAAPELEAGGPICAAMDLYGVGTVIFEALTGEPAFDPELPAVDRPEPAALPATVAPLLADAVRGLLRPDPMDRPGMAELMRDVALSVEDEQSRPWPAWADGHVNHRFAKPDVPHEWSTRPSSDVSA